MDAKGRKEIWQQHYLPIVSIFRHTGEGTFTWRPVEISSPSLACHLNMEMLSVSWWATNTNSFFLSTRKFRGFAPSVFTVFRSFILPFFSIVYSEMDSWP